MGIGLVVIKNCFAFLLQHMVKMSFDVVKRWVNEAQEAASSDNIMVQVGKMFAPAVLYSGCLCAYNTA